MPNCCPPTPPPPHCSYCYPPVYYVYPPEHRPSSSTSIQRHSHTYYAEYPLETPSHIKFKQPCTCASCIKGTRIKSESNSSNHAIHPRSTHDHARIPYVPGTLVAPVAAPQRRHLHDKDIDGHRYQPYPSISQRDSQICPNGPERCHPSTSPSYPVQHTRASKSSIYNPAEAGAVPIRSRLNPDSKPHRAPRLSAERREEGGGLRVIVKSAYDDHIRGGTTVTKIHQKSSPLPLRSRPRPPSPPPPYHDARIVDSRTVDSDSSSRNRSSTDSQRRDDPAHSKASPKDRHAPSTPHSALSSIQCMNVDSAYPLSSISNTKEGPATVAQQNYQGEMSNHSNQVVPNISGSGSMNMGARRGYVTHRYRLGINPVPVNTIHKS